MSDNLILFGTRILTTESGRKIVDNKQVKEILQTPTKVTHEILQKQTFDERLNAYCKWVEENYENYGYWTVVGDFQQDSLEMYKNFNSNDYLYFGEEKILRTQYVADIQYPGDEKFEELKDSENYSIIAAVHIKDMPVREMLSRIIKDMRDDEYTMEWDWI